VSNRKAHRCKAKLGTHAELYSLRNGINEAKVKISKQIVNAGMRPRTKELLMFLSDAS